MGSGRWLGVVVAFGAACSSAPPPSSESDAGAMVDASPIAPAPAELPEIAWWSATSDAIDPATAPPTLRPCPTGWHEVDDGVARCEPWPEGGQADCPLGLAHFPGTPGCTDVGRACPSGEWPEGLPSGVPVLHVRAGASGGDGTVALPFGTIREALARATSGTIVAIAAGTYDEGLVVPAGVTLRGACPARTLLTRSSGDIALDDVVIVTAGTVTIEDLRIGESAVEGVRVQGATATLILDGVVVVRTTSRSIVVEAGATFRANELVVADAQPRPTDRGGSSGVVVAGASSAEIVRAVFARNRYANVFADEGSTLHLEDVAITDTSPRLRDGDGGMGILTQRAATVDGTRVVIERNAADGALAIAGTLRLTDSVVRSGEDAGVAATADGSASLTRVVIDDNAEAGVVSWSGHVTMTDGVVRATRQHAGVEQSGWGLVVEIGGSLDVERTLIDRNFELGVWAADLGSTLSLTDVIVRDVPVGKRADRTAAAVGLHRGVSATLTRVLLEGAHGLGLYVDDDGAGTQLTVRDLVVRDTQGRDLDGAFGFGVEILGGATATFERVLLERNAGVAFMPHDPGTVANVVDLVVRDTASERDTRAFGRGIDCFGGALVTVTRASIERSRDLAVFAGGAGTIATLEDVVVSEIAPQACATSDCASALSATGVGSYLGAAMTVRRFIVREAELCGAQVAMGGDLTLESGVIASSAIGACVQVDDYDLSKLTTGVRYEDNGTNLQATMLPVPSEAVPAPR